MSNSSGPWRAAWSAVGTWCDLWDVESAGQLRLLPNPSFGFGVNSDSIMGERLEEVSIWGQRVNSALAPVEFSRLWDYTGGDLGWKSVS